jgi:hypothetical protein
LEENGTAELVIELEAILKFIRNGYTSGWGFDIKDKVG